MKTLTIETLSKALNGRIWEKFDKRRIYLDKGYNTKKMKTTTYIEYYDENIYDVKCFIECPSQPWQWIKKEQEMIIEEVYKEIEDFKNKDE